MRAVTIVDGRIEVQEHWDPVAGTGELLVRVEAAGLNGADLLQLGGRYPPPADGSPTDIPGLEMASEVVAVGPKATRFSVGDRVMAVVSGGGQAELCLVQERLALAVPEGVSWSEAGGFPEVFATAHDAIFTQCHLGPGERLLVHGAAGGVGTAAVQLGAVAGARVTATVREPSLRALVAALGADIDVVDPADFVTGGPFDVILELVGAPNMAANLAALATNGRIVVIGLGGGSKVADFDLSLLMARRATIRSSTLRSRPLEEKALVARWVEAAVLPHLAAGRVRVPVAATFSLDQAPAAYERFRAGGKLGKIVLVTGRP